jgi:energy-coupling factor transporter ATP-binding protein EcfA2
MATSIAAEPIPSPFELKQYDPVSTKSKMQPYGVPFMDVYLGGGGVAGEIYVLLGPTGSGKTSILQQLSISLAALQVAKWEHSNKRHSLGMSYFVSYEMAGPEIMARTYANFAQIDIQKIFEGVPLSRPGELSPQDQVLFAKAIEYGIRVPSEKERYDLAKKRLGENWRLLDYSGMSLNEDEVPTPEKGSGLWPEIAAQIAADLEYYQKRGQKRHVAGIFIDYIGIMAHRHCQFHDKDPSRHIRIICNESPQNARSYLSYRFHCPVFLAHQLNAAAVKLKPGQIASMTEAQESKTLADNCNAVFVISRQTEDEHRLIRINRQKGRRLPGMGPCILQVQGQYARVREVGSLWSWDELTRQFIPQSELDVAHYREENTGTKPIRFDGQEFETFSISE